MLKDTERFIELTLASVAIWFLVASYALRIIQSNTSKGITNKTKLRLIRRLGVGIFLN